MSTKINLKALKRIYFHDSEIDICVMESSLLHSRFYCRHAMLLRDDTKNGRAADHMESEFSGNDQQNL